LNKRPTHLPKKRIEKSSMSKKASAVELALGHAAFAMMLTILDELVANGTISVRRMGVISKLARGRLIAVPSYATANNLLELEQAERDTAIGLSH
jgi:hypothetical protein